MNDITIIHEEILTYLLNVREMQPDLRFSLRRNNREGRLEDGYWFHGNDAYVAISFWSGNDWKNRTPNIIFVIFESGETRLEVNVTDSQIKREFVQQILADRIGLSLVGKRYLKQYNWPHYLPSFMEFVNEEKLVIDDILRQNQSFFTGRGEDDRIGFFSEDEFEVALSKTLSFRSQLDIYQRPLENKSLRSIEIKSFGPVKHAYMQGIPENNQWIFLTGENGTGKTTVLRAIATLLGDEEWDYNDFAAEQTTVINGSLYTSHSEIIQKERTSEILTRDRDGILVSGFAAYGASRLTNLSSATGVIKQFRKRSTPLYNLTHTDGILFDLLTKYRQWYKMKDKGKLKERLENIKLALLELIPNLNNIEFELGQIPQTIWFIEEDEHEEVFGRVRYHQLASGIRSMVAMFGDMMCRLFDQQPDKTDPAELTGVVLIDEIDLHLHPKLQKRLVEQLSNTFQKIQFIVTTHSPIPLLGASKRSRFFKVKRTHEDDIKIVDLSDINVQEMLPNAILTSDLFNMEGLFSRADIAGEDIRTEDNYKDIRINDEVRARLKQIADRIKNADESSN